LAFVALFQIYNASVKDNNFKNECQQIDKKYLISMHQQKLTILKMHVIKLLISQKQI
jgi:hypothetical protein